MKTGPLVKGLVKLASIVPMCREELGWGYHRAHWSPGITFISRLQGRSLEVAQTVPKEGEARHGSVGYGCRADELGRWDAFGHSFMDSGDLMFSGLCLCTCYFFNMESPSSHSPTGKLSHFSGLCDAFSDPIPSYQAGGVPSLVLSQHFGCRSLPALPTGVVISCSWPAPPI